MTRRVLLLLAALLLAAIGTGLVWVYVQDADSRARAGQATVQILVATSRIEPGSGAADVRKASTVKEVPSDLRADGALANLDGLAPGAVLAYPVGKGQQLTKDAFASSPSTVAEKKVDLAVAIGYPQHVADSLQPGEDVAVYVLTGKSDTTTLDKRLDRARVLKVDQAKNVVTFEVPQVDAETIAKASANGTLLLMLLPPEGP